MGEKMRRLVAQNRLIEATNLIELDLTECGFMLPEADITQLSAGGIDAHLAVARIVLNAAINAAYGDGMDRRDGQLWAGWQEVLSGAEARFSLTAGQLEWAAAILAKDDLKLPAGMAQWREAIIDYMELAKLNARREPAAVTD